MSVVTVATKGSGVIWGLTSHLGPYWLHPRAVLVWEAGAALGPRPWWYLDLNAIKACVWVCYTQSPDPQNLTMRLYPMQKQTVFIVS